MLVTLINPAGNILRDWCLRFLPCCRFARAVGISRVTLCCVCQPQVFVLVELLHSVTSTFDRFRAVRYQQSLAKELQQHHKWPQVGLCRWGCAYCRTSCSAFGQAIQFIAANHDKPAPRFQIVS